MLKKLGYKWHLLVKNPKLSICKCKIKFYNCKNNLLNQIITSYAQEIRLQVTFISKNPKNCEFTSVKPTFTSVNWL